MRYLSVCAGIEAASVAWHALGWRAAAFSEIEPFPRAVLRHHWPDVPIHGRDRLKGETFEDHAADAGFQTIGAEDYGTIDLLVGGTPCQSFSVAGKRGGMADGRGNLALEYIRLAHRKRPRWVVWENVPGVFSSNGGEDFRCFLSGLVRWDVPIPDGGWANAGVIAAGPADGAFGVAWRVLDAQFAGVPQRRRRVFVVGYSGDWRRAAAVLFERHGLQGYPAPRREKGQGTADRAEEGAGVRSHWDGDYPHPTLNQSAKGSGGVGASNQELFSQRGAYLAPASTHRMVAFGEYEDDGTASALKARDYKDATDLVAHALTANGFDASEDGTGRGTPLVPVAIQERAISENPSAGPDGAGFRTDGQAVAYSMMPMNSGKDFKARKTDVAQPLMAGGPVSGNQGGDVITEGVPATRLGSAVRRLTPRECERLQGFPDDYTRIDWPGWRDMDPDETPDGCREEGLEIRETKPGKWRVKDVDGPRYKALGNSMAVPVMRWIGERIQAVENLRLNDSPPLEDAA